ncbi:MAG: hypothetical protein M3437_03975 [Chloroflexota bacterium]|nr:hypothetical protein [Chloroflexota bacterium]MDQ5864486.1 hypothetical protein [Chloroflexota bacterium]
MRKNTRLWLVLFMVLGMALSLGGAASAQTNPFPTTKQPSSGRFDISGSYKISASGGSLDENVNINATISGGGAFSGQNMQMDMTLNMDVPESAGGPSGAGGPSSTTISMILVDGRLYMKLPGMSGEDRWVVTDAGEMGAGGPMGGMTGGVGGMTGLDPKYADAYTVTQEGKENLNGAPTTRYRIDVDFEKLQAAMGSEMGTPMPEDASSQMTYVMHIWIGDNDMYLHKMHMLMDSTTTISESDMTLRMTIDFTFAFRDFDQPITITAPANAEEIDLSSAGLNPNVIPAVAGMPGSVATGMGMGMPAIGTGMAGMPRTGMPSSAFPIEIAALAALGLLCMVLGGVARRVSVRN